MQAITLWSSSSLKHIESFEKSGLDVRSCHSGLNWNSKSFIIYCARFIIKVGPFPGKGFKARRKDWEVAFAFDTSGIPSNGSQDSMSKDNNDLGQTRLGRLLSAGGRQLFQKLNSSRKNFPMKIFLLLLGFYTANALATILGQTGDWDVLVAGIVVAAIEGIGMLMYRKPPSLSSARLQSLVMMINYWKAGVCLGLFVDAFKLGS